MVTRSRKSPIMKSRPMPEPAITVDTARQERAFDWVVGCCLLLLGIHNSIRYFGMQQVPNSDWAAFITVAKNVLSWNFAVDLQRAPLLGIMQILVSKILAARAPELVAGWLINAILHPFTALLLWLAGRELLGRSAWFFAVIAIINPQVMSMVQTPIVETVYLFFIVLTFVLIFRRSRWSYLFAAVASMLRYEAVMLIPAMLAVDVLTNKDKRRWLKSAGYAVLAAVPIMLWALATAIHWDKQSQLTYVREIGTASGGKIVVVEFIRLIWQGGFSQMFWPGPDVSGDTVETLFALSKTAVAGFFIFGSIYGLCRRQWNILALLIFLLPYIVIHALHSVLDLRYIAPASWIVLLICLYGMRSVWGILNRNGRMPMPLVRGLQVLVLVPVVLWLGSIIGYIGETKAISPPSYTVVYVAIAAGIAVFAAARFIYRARYLWSDTVLLAVFCLIAVSNQFTLASVVQDGRYCMEFKKLADWYCDNAKAGEKLATTMAGPMGLVAPAQANYFVHTATLTGQNPQEFVDNCRKQGIAYVAWDSRMALDRDKRFYKLWHLETTEFLSQPRDAGPFVYVTTITENERQYVHVFRLKP
jgi:hypothetical protein